METFNRLTTGAKVVLGATVVFVIVSFFHWFEVEGTDAGINMWHGVGVVAGLIALVLLAWQLLPLANIKFDVGVSSTMVTMALAALLALFTLLRVLFGYEGFDRTIWLWLGLLLAIVAAVGAFMNMQSAGESFGDMKKSFSSMSSRGGTSERDAATPPAATPPAGPAGTDEPDETRTT